MKPLNLIKSRNKSLRKVNNTFAAKYHLYSGEQLHWAIAAMRLEKSVVSAILPWVIFYGLYGFLISLLYSYKLPMGFIDDHSLGINVILSFNIGLTLLLVFRTNSAHQRFWEGRQLWGALVNTTRNLSRDIWIAVKEKSSEDRLEKESTIRLLVAFAVAMKLHLRSELVNDEVASLMSSDRYLHIKDTNHPSLQIAFWLGDYLQTQYERQLLPLYQLTALHKLVDELVNILGGCERILRTPIPLIYTIRLKQMVLIYCLVMPFDIVDELKWWTGLVIAFSSFILLSIEEIGSEIEEPFGKDPNDLPLDVICNTINRNLEELIKLASNVDQPRF